MEYVCDAEYLYDEQGERVGIVEVISLLFEVNRDMVEKANLIQYKAKHDYLTKIYNREYFYEKTAELLHDNPAQDYVLVLWNIKRFKVVNEVFGTETGDRVLKNIAAKLTNTFGEDCTYGRLELDNFAFCCPKAKLSLEWLRQNSTLTLISDTEAYSFRAYFGLYEAVDRDLTVRAMFDRAKMALQTVKASDGNSYAIYDKSLRDGMLEEQELVSQMELALFEKQFAVYYQPIYSISTGKIVAAEALARWIHPTKGVIPPWKFIPLFERNGLITQLDRYIWNETCKMIRQQLEQGEIVVPVSVNVSRVDFYNQHLYEDIVEIVERNEIDRKYLRIEVTESAYADNPQQLINIVGNLRQAGFVVLMDDFGSGYSSLNTLKEIPVDILKIDLKFLEHFETLERVGKIVASIIRMAKWLELEVVAEGVETKEQMEFLKSLGCDKGQGFYYARPQPLAKFKKLLLNDLVEYQEVFCESVENIHLDAIWNTSREGCAMFNSIIGALGFYELVGNNLEIIRVNEGYKSLMCADNDDIFCDAMKVLEKVAVSDREVLLAQCNLAQQQKTVEEAVIRCRRYDGVTINLRVRIRYLGARGSRKAFYFALEEKTPRLSAN